MKDYFKFNHVLRLLSGKSEVASSPTSKKCLSSRSGLILKSSRNSTTSASAFRPTVEQFGIDPIYLNKTTYRSCTRFFAAHPTAGIIAPLLMACYFLILQRWSPILTNEIWKLDLGIRLNPRTQPQTRVYQLSGAS